MKRVLMVAYHFPPLAGSRGRRRTLRFVQHLPRFGWEPTVLTIHSRAYERTSDDLAVEVKKGTLVHRAFGLDAARHLSVAGRYPGFLARPDRWMTWQYDAKRVGMRVISEWRPDVIWSTYPIATAHVIGEALHRRSGIPWVADFRDPMAQDGYPADPQVWRQFKRIEESAVQNARFSVFTTPGAARVYRDRYPQSADRIVVVENGFDEDSFEGLTGMGAAQPLDPARRILLHSGVVYPSERDPTQLMVALRNMIAAGSLKRDSLRIRFRAAGHEALLLRLARENGVEDMIELLPAVAYRAALEEMTRADGLLLLQAENCNEQIPAKIYEYLRVARPILALTHASGDTAGVMRSAGLDTVAALDSPAEIGALIGRFVRDPAALPLPAPSFVTAASRLGRARALADLLGRVDRVSASATC
jgi:hypothetical protein